MTVPSPRLILPVKTEFLEGLRFLCGDGLLAEIKQQLVPVALDLIRISLLGNTHPLETLRGLADLHWEDLLENLTRTRPSIVCSTRLRSIPGYMAWWKLFAGPR